MSIQPRVFSAIACLAVGIGTATASGLSGAIGTVAPLQPLSYGIDIDAGEQWVFQAGSERKVPNGIFCRIYDLETGAVVWIGPASGTPVLLTAPQGGIWTLTCRALEAPRELVMFGREANPFDWRLPHAEAVLSDAQDREQRP